MPLRGKRKFLQLLLPVPGKVFISATLKEGALKLDKDAGRANFNIK